MKNRYSGEDLGKLIIENMKANGYNSMSFIDIEDLFDEVGYDYRADDHDCIRLSAFDNLYVWLGWTTEAQDAITYLMENGYHMHGVQPFEYYIRGKVPNLPLIRNLKSYKKPHWYPVIIEKDYPGMEIKDEELFKQQCAKGN